MMKNCDGRGNTTQKYHISDREKGTKTGEQDLRGRLAWKKRESSPNHES